MKTTIDKPTWSFLNKWFTYDKENGDASNVVVCPNCAPVLENDPSLRTLENQNPDPSLSCSIKTEGCMGQWL